MFCVPGEGRCDSLYGRPSQNIRRFRHLSHVRRQGDSARMCAIQTILSSIEFWKIVAPIAFAVVAWLFNEHSKRQWERWQLKKAACLNALNIANAVLSNYEYSNVKKNDITPQYESVDAVRACFNELACTCDQPDVIDALKKIMFEPAVSPAEILNLRTAVRKELRMSRRVVDTDKEKAFVAKVNCGKPGGT